MRHEYFLTEAEIQAAIAAYVCSEARLDEDSAEFDIVFTVDKAGVLTGAKATLKESADEEEPAARRGG